MSIGFTEILLILFIVLILFGAKRLPEVAKSMGKAYREFKKEFSSFEEKDNEIKEESSKNNRDNKN
ncbi:MAG: twin-arginine translocase TatA/TatE family subunit [Candidatus Mcinerneyibacterium aminivorans]|uniref:Sec-independent protein translocase protein TatA n=1 Tax=Candidatus Mcinerneyibacterium aminivorans TaxID=2703815 RepID=A0A5D0MDB2_9BACT|nr:MAG: twin-arginine translocase TatA/TatE family subunit [Candidatus Mcinerneyibacterium aminivorans]